MNFYEVLEYVNKNNKYKKIRLVVIFGWVGGYFQGGE